MSGVTWLRTLGLTENSLDGATAAATGHLHARAGRNGPPENGEILEGGSSRLSGTDLDVELVGVLLGHCCGLIQ